nr:CPBP family intramembrane glutamic endopeptidase [Evansella caseinilytica]
MNKQAELIKKLTDRELLLNLYLTQLLMLAVVVVLSKIMHGSWFYPLRFLTWNGPHFLIGAGTALLVVLIELSAVKYLPKAWFDDGGINERIFHNRSPLHIGFLSLFISISEELLFRGVLQTAFGLVPASLIFAVIHVRYLHSFFLFSFTVGLSFFLGYLYWLTGNLLTVISCHFFIDTLLGLAIRYKVLDKLQKRA